MKKISVKIDPKDFDLKDNNLVLTPDPVWLEVLPKPEAEKRRMLADPAYRAQMRSTIGERWGEGPAPRWAADGVWGQSVYFRDPDGNLLEFLSTAEPMEPLFTE